MRARGHVVDVVSMGHRADVDGPDPDAFPLPRGASRDRLRAARAARTLAGALREGRPLRDASRRAWLVALADERRWDAVVAHFAGEAAELAVPAARDLGVPAVVVVHAVDLFVPRSRLSDTLGAATVVTICAHHQRWLRERHGVEAHVVRCRAPLDVPAARPDEGGAAPRWISVARDVPKKGLPELVAAVRSGGVGTLRLVSDAFALGGPGIAVGPLAPPEVPAALARAHAFALPCRVAPDGDRDGVPVAILEAMAAGLPVVSTAVSGVPEVVDDAVGWLVPPDDPVALTRALRAAASDPAERARRGAAARARAVAAGGVERQVDELLAVLASARPAR